MPGMRARGTHKLGYVPALDGLRAIAVSSVILAHAGAVPSAIGVDVFFVLSGFLITHLLIEEWSATGRISVRDFYIRRILRLWPALWVMVLLTWAVLYLSGIHGSVKHWTLLGAAVSALFYLANWVRALGGHAGIYGHTWSLGVEEQFYIVWALLLPVWLRRFGMSGARWLTLALIASSVTWGVFLLNHGASMERLYNGFGTNIDGCLLGCAVALFITDARYRSMIQAKMEKFRYVGWAALFGLMAIMITRFPERPLAFILVSPVISVFSALVVIDIVVCHKSLRHLLEFPPLVRLGVISYGVYLWHYPLITGIWLVPKYLPETVPIRLLVGFVGGVGMAELSYRVVEKPFLKLKTRFSRLDAVRVSQPTPSPTDVLPPAVRSTEAAP